MPRRRALLQPTSEERLEKLISTRLEPGADKESIDRRIWDLFGETWCIMFTDLSGFSRNVAEFGIIHFLQTIYESEELLVPIIENNDGTLLKVEGDSFLVIFRRPDRALQASLEMQRKLHQVNTDRSDEEQILLCIGLGFGPILRIGDSDVFGAEVNAASKLGEDVAREWEILVTGAVRHEVEGFAGIEWEDLDTAPPGAESAHRVIYERK